MQMREGIRREAFGRRSKLFGVVMTTSGFRYPTSDFVATSTPGCNWRPAISVITFPIPANFGVTHAI
jgi:hypothetical protein